LNYTRAVIFMTLKDNIIYNKDCQHFFEDLTTIY